MAKHSILVVDDEPEMLYSLQQLLRREFEVHVAASGRDGLEILQQRPIHVVMTDQRMPEMTGVELLKRARCEYPDAIRVIFTGYVDLKALMDAINQGNVYKFVAKPWDPEELQAVLRHACDEYDRLVERKRLLEDLKAQLTSFVSVAEALLGGAALDEAGRQKVSAFIGAAKPLVERLDHVVPARCQCT